MDESIYEVFDCTTKLGTNLTLDACFCLIKGYVDMHFEKSLNITIREINPKYDDCVYRG